MWRDSSKRNRGGDNVHFNKNKFKNIIFSSTIFVIFTRKFNSTILLYTSQSHSQFYDSHNVKFYFRPRLFSYPLNHGIPIFSRSQQIPTTLYYVWKSGALNGAATPGYAVALLFVVSFKFQEFQQNSPMNSRLDGDRSPVRTKWTTIEGWLRTFREDNKTA